MYVNICVDAQRPERVLHCPKLESQKVVSLLTEVLQLNSSPLQEQQVILAIEQSLSGHHLSGLSRLPVISQEI